MRVTSAPSAGNPLIAPGLPSPGKPVARGVMTSSCQPGQRERPLSSGLAFRAVGGPGEGWCAPGCGDEAHVGGGELPVTGVADLPGEGEAEWADASEVVGEQRFEPFGVTGLLGGAPL